MGFKIRNRAAFIVLCMQIIGPVIIIGGAYLLRGM